MHANIKIECGIHALSGGYKEELKWLVKATAIGAFLRHGISLSISPYTSLHSTYSGGRPSSENLGSLSSLVRDLSSEGIEFVLAMNGGDQYPGKPPISRDERMLLDIMNECSSPGLHHKVTITRPHLRREIMRGRPLLHIVASCIMQYSAHAEHDYNGLFSDYHYVVPANPHTTYAFLKRYQGYASKMIVFLNLPCGSPKPKLCQLHYLERAKAMGNCAYSEGRIAPLANNPFVPCQLNPEDQGCPRLDDLPKPTTLLINRTYDLRNLLTMGVNYFKVARDTPLLDSDIAAIARALPQ